jgi:hypothetical protein
MSKIHGKHMVVTVATNDISPYCKTSSYTRSAKNHETSGYGDDDEDYEPGLKGGKFTMGGVYDSTATVGPRNALHSLVGTRVAVTRQPEGTGSGLPQDAFTMTLDEYVESAPNDDMVTWSASGTIAGGVTSSTQS